MLYIHGTSDPVVGYSGTSQYFGNLGLGADAIIDYWKNANHCVGRFDLKPGANSIDLSGLTEGLYFIKGANGIASKVLLTK